MKRNEQRGFSLIELMIVVVIILLVAAMATPSMTRAITTIRLRSGVSSIGGLIQKARIEAVRSNRIMVVRQDFLSDKYTPVFFVDGAANAAVKIQDATKQNGSWDKWESMVTINPNITLESEGTAPAFPYNDLLGYNNGASDPPFAVAFNQRGLPCNIVSTVGGGQVTDCKLFMTQTTTSTASYQYFFHYNSTFGDQWASLTVTPAGRVRVWTWNGKNWN
jgi:prepilin-type N-terminal cleavage/methylation domain-containing protein